MAILYAPTIDTPLPSFFVSDGKLTLYVPIIDNKFVYKEQYTKFALLIKNNSTGAIIGDPIFSDNAGYAQFVFPEKYFIGDTALLKAGNYYKIQIAYATNDEIGVYSSATIVKYTQEPTVTGSFDSGLLTFKYTNNDPNERISTYSIKIYKDTELVYDTGVLLHQRDSDKIEGTTINTYKLTSIDSLLIPGNLSDNFIYHYFYTYTTVNSYSASCELVGTGNVKVPSRFLDSNFAILEAKLEEENACVDLTLNNNGAPADTVAGSYTIYKMKLNNATTTNYDNYIDWEYVTTIIIDRPLEGAYRVVRDYCVENGAVYVYAISQYNKFGVQSSLHYSNVITIKFDYAYLVDKTHQLKINFNPKVSSFKNDLLESKLDTIGSQYPYIFRNGIVKYKEFPISGLLSKRSDEDNLFTETSFLFEDMTRSSTPHDYDSNLTIDEVAVEQKYKMEVLEWLNNGQPKLFKSPTEGNFIVRLLNVSLSPEDILGRMLHTFSATAYEIAAYAAENLVTYNIIDDKRNQYIERYEVQRIGSGSVAGLVDAPLSITGSNIGLQIYGVNTQLPHNNVIIELIHSDGTVATLTAGSTGQVIIQPGEYDIESLSVTADAAAENITGTYFYTYNQTNQIPFNRYKRAVLDNAITIDEINNDDDDYIDIIPLLVENNVEFIRDLHSISHLQFIRRYHIHTNMNRNYKVKIKYANDTEYQIIDLENAYEYQTDNSQKITSLLLPNGVKSVLCYKMVTIYTVEE